MVLADSVVAAQSMDKASTAARAVMASEAPAPQAALVVRASVRDADPMDSAGKGAIDSVDLTLSRGA